LAFTPLLFFFRLRGSWSRLTLTSIGHVPPCPALPQRNPGWPIGSQDSHHAETARQLAGICGE